MFIDPQEDSIQYSITSCVVALVLALSSVFFNNCFLVDPLFHSVAVLEGSNTESSTPFLLTTGKEGSVVNLMSCEDTAASDSFVDLIGFTNFWIVREGRFFSIQQSGKSHWQFNRISWIQCFNPRFLAILYCRTVSPPPFKSSLLCVNSFIYMLWGSKRMMPLLMRRTQSITLSSVLNLLGWAGWRIFTKLFQARLTHHYQTFLKFTIKFHIIYNQDEDTHQYGQPALGSN